MSKQMSDEDIYKLAKSRVEARRGFFVHLGVYLVVNAMLVFIWTMTGQEYPWFLWPLGGWGVGILLHCLSVFVFSRGAEEAVEKEYEKLKKGLKK